MADEARAAEGPGRRREPTDAPKPRGRIDSSDREIGGPVDGGDDGGDGADAPLPDPATIARAAMQPLEEAAEVEVVAPAVGPPAEEAAARAAAEGVREPGRPVEAALPAPGIAPAPAPTAASDAGPPLPRRATPGGTARRAFFWLFPRESTRFFVLTALSGVVAAGLAIAFRRALDGAQVLFFGPDGSLLEAAARLPWWKRLLIPTAGGAAAGFLALAVERFTGRSSAGGMAGIMEAVSIRHGLVRLPAALARATVSLMTIASGGSVGREGPIVQLGAAAASSLGRAVHLAEPRLRVLVGCGAAAGIAAAYNTPIAGTLFVLEIVVGTFAVEVVGPIAVAAVLATVLTRAALGGGPLYNVPAFQLVSPLELVAYTLLGLAAAVVGTAFLTLLERAGGAFRRIPGPPALRMAIGGLVVGGLGAGGLYHVYGNGFDTTASILAGERTLAFLALLVAAKMVATASTVGSGGPGGIFTPTLLLGAALGGILGYAWHSAFPERTADPGAYALVGMAALLAATTHAPFVSAVFVFEVSQDYHVILPLLLTTVVATVAARRLRPGSVYTDELKRRGLSWEGSAEERALRSIRVRDILRENVPLLPPTVPVADIVKTLLSTRLKNLYVGDAVGSRLQGQIDLHTVKAAIDAPELQGLVIAGDIARPVPSISPDASIVEANEALWRSEDEQLPVVDPESGKFLGIVTRRDLLGAIDREVLRRNVLLAKIQWHGDEGTVTDFFELPAGNRLEQVTVPPALEWATVAQADLRGRHGLNVIAVVRRRDDGTTERLVPEPDLGLQPGDVLVVIGKKPDIQAFGRGPGG